MGFPLGVGYQIHLRILFRDPVSWIHCCLKICDFYLFVNFIRIISFNFIVSTLYFILGCVEIVCINFVEFFVWIFSYICDKKSSWNKNLVWHCQVYKGVLRRRGEFSHFKMFNLKSHKKTSNMMMNFSANARLALGGVRTAP